MARTSTASTAMMMFLGRRLRATTTVVVSLESSSSAPLRHLADSMFIASIFPNPLGGSAASASVLAE
jgi:hypothetical protein